MTDGADAAGSRRPNDRFAPGHRRAPTRPALLWLWPVVFVAALAFFFWRSPHPVPSLSLRLTGETDTVRSAQIFTDTGAGFSEQESASVTFGAPGGEGARRLTVTALGRQSDAALSSEVWINGIVLEKGDGSTQTLLPGSQRDGVSRQGAAVERDNSLVLTAEGASFTLTAEFKRAKINLGTSTYSGGAQVSVDGQALERVDLYSQSGQPQTVLVAPTMRAGPYAVEVKLPQRPLRALRIVGRDGRLPIVRSAFLLGAEPAQRLDLGVDGWSERDSAEVHGLSFGPGALTPAHATMLIVGAAYFATFALALGYLLEHALSLARRARLRDDRRLLNSVRFGSAIALLLFAYNLLWVLGQWPGFLTIDSFEQIQEILSGHYANWHPYGHTLFLSTFLHFADAPGFLAAFQGLALSVLAGAFLAFAFLEGAPLPLVLLGALLLLLPHVAIYNLMIWRDVVFSLCVMAWFAIVFACALRAFRGERFTPGPVEFVLLTALLVLAATVRHNGLVLLLMIPGLLLLSGALPRRFVLTLAAASLALYAVSVGVVGNLLGAHRNTDYNLFRLALIVSPLIGIVNAPGGYVSDNPSADRALMERIWDVDQLIKTHSPLTVVPAIYAVPRKVALDGPEFAALYDRFFQLALMNPHLYVSERAGFFLATLGARSWAWRNNLWDPNPFDVAGRLPAQNEIPTVAYLHPDPILPALAGAEQGLLAPLAEPGPVPLWRAYAYPVTFTALPAFLLLLAALLLWPWLPATALASLPLLALCAGLFVTGISNDFRYVYYLYLFPPFALVAAVTEIRSRRLRRADSV